MSQLLPERRSASQARWEPLSDFEQITERMRRMLDQTFGGLGWMPLVTDSAGRWSPPVDIEETDDSYTIEAELPGIQAADVTIELVGNELAIAGEMKERERTGTVRRQTRRSGRFEYRVALPDQIDADKVEATLKDGILSVRAPKSERAQRRTIEVKS